MSAHDEQNHDHEDTVAGSDYATNQPISDEPTQSASQPIDAGATPPALPNQPITSQSTTADDDPSASNQAPNAASLTGSYTPAQIRLIQIADDQNTDTAVVRILATGETQLIPLFTYLIADSDPGTFFLQIATRNRNLSRFSPQPFDTISLAQMLALIQDRGYSAEALVSNVSYYDAVVAAIIDPDTDEASTAYVRPTTGTIHRLADPDEITRYLDLPPAHGVDFRIGILARSGHTEVPINLSAEILDHHILVAGSTGSGKSHLLSNIGHAATSAGRCTILFDHKPDHQHHHFQNSDPRTQNPRAYSLNGQDPSAIPVRYWTLDENDPNLDAVQIEVRAMDLDSEILAGTIFYRPNEDIQAEVFAQIASWYADDQQNNNRIWTIQNLRDYIRDTADGQIRTQLYGNNTSASTLPTATMGAIRRKVNVPGRTPNFVDPQPQANPLTGARRQTGLITQIFQPGLNVIRIPDSDRRGYALFLKHLLDAASSYRANATQTGNEQACDLEIIIDEAADIFTADSRFLRDAATGMLSEQIRKGRSLHIGYVIAVQSAGDVPEDIRNNLNSTIVGRHRNLAILREALPTARADMLEQADRLSPGEMFADIFGVFSLLLTKMDFSRSQLTVAN